MYKVKKEYESGFDKYKKGQTVFEKAQNIELIETDYQKSQMCNEGFYAVTKQEK